MKSSLWRLGFVLLVLAAIRRSGLDSERGSSSVLLAAGALLLSALFAGKLAKRVGLPRLTGYLVIGIALGPYALGMIPEQSMDGLEVVKGLAVSLIALAAGAELELGLLKKIGFRALRLCLIVCGLVFLVSLGSIVALRPFIGFFSGMTLPQVIAVGSVLAAIVVSFSPTVTIAIVQETRARGDFTEFLMAMVIVGDLVVLIAFAVSIGVAKASFGGGFDLAGLAGSVGWEIFGSIGIGLLVGLGTALYLRHVRKEIAFFITTLCFVSAEAGARLHLSPLILALTAGALIANLDAREARSLSAAIEKVSLPVFALFFAAAGAGLHLGALSTVGFLAVLLVAVRGAGVYFACRVASPPDLPELRHYLWMGLISQAGVTFGLASLARRSFPEFGAALEVLVVAMITVHELVGPVLLRRALMQTGQIDPEPVGAQS